jgi:purine-binding chemotaxis protein CheW
VEGLNTVNQVMDLENEELTQFLTFCLDAEIYAAPILDVQEIRSWEPVTRVPNTPGYLKGIVNIRGAIVPVVDLRLRLGIAAKEYTSETVVIVMSVNLEAGPKQIGLVVDAVSDVVSVNETDIQGTPDFGEMPNKEFIFGMANVDDKAVMFLDNQRLLMIEDVELAVV